MPPRRRIEAINQGSQMDETATHLVNDRVEEGPPLVRKDVPPLDVLQPDPMQMHAQLTTLTNLVRGLMAVVERLDGRNSMPTLEDALRPLGAAMVGNQNPSDSQDIPKGIRDSENHRDDPRP